MRRRGFGAVVGGAAAGWPLAVRAVDERRIGVLAPGSDGDPDQLYRLKVFEEALRNLGWTNRRNVHIEIRLAAGSAERFRTYAAELIALRSEVLVADSSPSTSALQR